MKLLVSRDALDAESEHVAELALAETGTPSMDADVVRETPVWFWISHSIPQSSRATFHIHITKCRMFGQDAETDIAPRFVNDSFGVIHMGGELEACESGCWTRVCWRKPVEIRADCVDK